MTADIPWLGAGDPFPDLQDAWGKTDPAPGLLAAGGSLDTEHLLRAYSSGIFPWFSQGQPLLWWSPDPRMVLNPAEFKLHRSLRQAVRRQIASPHSQIRIDSDFRRTINACATSSRAGQNGTWIVPEMVEAYCALHAAGYAHSVETWMDGELVGGLYCVAIGRAVFGESMFASRTDASKIALAALVAFCRTNAVELVDCQQNTRHLASLGAYEMPRTRFLAAVEKASAMPSMVWEFEPLYWNQLIALPQD